MNKQEYIECLDKEIEYQKEKEWVFRGTGRKRELTAGHIFGLQFAKNNAKNLLEAIDQLAQEYDVEPEKIREWLDRGHEQSFFSSESMNLADKLKSASDQAYDEWFDKWFKSKDFANRFLKAASEGFAGLCINFSDYDELTRRRMRDSKTVERLSEKFPDLNVKYGKIERKNIINQKYYTEEIIFTWSEGDEMNEQPSSQSNEA